MNIFLMGIFLGVVLSIPSGPAGLLIIKNTVSGKRYGRYALLGLLVAQALYSLLYIFGIHKYLSETSWLFQGMSLLGGLLIYVNSISCAKRR